MPTVEDLFDVEYGHSLSLNALKQTDSTNGYAFVSRTARNNGVAAYIEKPAGLEPREAGLLTVCLRSRNYTLATFVQPRAFFCAYHIQVLTPKTEMTLQEKLWWAQCITANRYRFNFGRQANRTLATLELPDEMPAWVRATEVPSFEQPAHGATSVPDLSTDTWQPYRIGALFDVARGRNVLKRDMVAGGTAYVSASASNNGISAMIDSEADYPGGQITVASNGSVGEAFYQPYPFIASGDVSVLLSKRPLTSEASLFVCSVISAEKYRWNYGRKWSVTRLRASTFKLPATDSGEPDWDGMADYIRSFPLAAALGYSSSV